MFLAINSTCINYEKEINTVHCQLNMQKTLINTCFMWSIKNPVSKKHAKTLAVVL